MPGEISCRILRPLFRYAGEHGIDPADLTVGLFPVDDLFQPERWIATEQFVALLERAATLLEDPSLAAHAGAAAAELYPLGPISPQDSLATAPEILLAQAGDMLNLLQREAQISVPIHEPGRVVIECIPPAGHHPHSCLCTYIQHFLEAIPKLWPVHTVQVRETQCAVPVDQVRRLGGPRWEVDPKGQVWEVAEDGDPVYLSPLGQVEADGTFVLDGTCYGADRCSYEITWSPPAPGWRRFLAHLNPLRWIGDALFRQFQAQKETIQLLRDQVRDLNRTMEARVLERTEELRQKARRMALVEQAGRRFGAILEPTTLFQEVVRTLREDLGYFSVALYVLEGETLVLQALNTGDNTVVQRVGQNFPVSAQALEMLWQAGRPLVQHNLVSQPHPLGLQRQGRGRSALTAPLITSYRLLGVLDAQSPRENRYDDDDALILHAVATQAALSLERSQLYREEQRARQQADTMSSLARVINTTLELGSLLSLALDQLRRVLPYDAAAIILKEENTPIPTASTGFPPQSEALLSALFADAPSGTLKRVLQECVPVLLGTSAQPTLPAQLAHFSSWLAVPLTLRGTAAGALLLAARAPRAYESQDLHLAGGLAGQIATALSNARLYERIRQDRDRLESLYRVARELNTDLDIDKALRHILGLAQDSVGATSGSIIMVDEAGQPAHSILLRPNTDTEAILKQVLRDGAAGWVIRNKQGLLIPDTNADPRWLRFPNEIRPTGTAIAVPLLMQGQVRGVLTVTHPHAGHLGPDDLELLTSIAGQASSVVQRAHLFAAVRGERARLETVIEGTADAVIVLDEAGRVLRINYSAADLFGLEVAAVTGRSLAQALQHPELAALLRPIGDPGARRRTEIPLADGRTMYATLTPIPEVGSVITMQDITDLKELDRMKSDFVANVSHDLRTPLGAVQVLVETLEMAGPLSSEQASFVQQILHQVEGMSELVENLLDLAKIEAGVEMEMAPCQLAAVIAESLDQLAGPAAIRPVHLQAEIPEDLPLVWGNGRRLGQVVNNLLDNAIKYTPPNSEVLLNAYVEGKEVRVNISDQGPGIPATDLPRLFEKFYRARKPEASPQGTGLGLSIAHSIVQAHGGRIWAESQEGQGSVFSFALPLFQSE